MSTYRTGFNYRFNDLIWWIENFKYVHLSQSASSKWGQTHITFNLKKQKKTNANFFFRWRDFTRIRLLSFSKISLQVLICTIGYRYKWCCVSFKKFHMLISIFSPLRFCRFFNWLLYIWAILSMLKKCSANVRYFISEPLSRCKIYLYFSPSSSLSFWNIGDVCNSILLNE